MDTSTNERPSRRHTLGDWLAMLATCALSAGLAAWFAAIALGPY